MTKRVKPLIHDIVGRGVMASPRLRRAAWRAGRSLYCMARGEQRADDMRVDGELDLQRRAVEAHRADSRFVAFDVGANQGDWTLALIDAFRAKGNIANLDAHIFEPVPTTRERLATRLNAACAQNVRINAEAASDKAGALEMIITSDTGGTNSVVYDEVMAKQALGFVSVQVTTLDLYCSESGIGHINIVKCDTEGHDLAVLRGAAGLLKEGRIDIFQFEYNHRWIFARAFLKDVFDLIEGLPYRLGRVMPSSIEFFESWHPELERYYQSNYVLVREPCLEWFTFRQGNFDKSNVYA